MNNSTYRLNFLRHSESHNHSNINLRKVSPLAGKALTFKRMNT